MFRILLATLVVWNALGDGKYLYQNFNMLVKNLEFLFLCFFIYFDWKVTKLNKNVYIDVS